MVVIGPVDCGDNYKKTAVETLMIVCKKLGLRCDEIGDKKTMSILQTKYPQIIHREPHQKTTIINMSELIKYIDIPEGSVPLGYLDRRGKELSSSLREIQHNSERKEQIKKELGNIAFELWCRYEAGEIEFAPE